MKLALFLCVLCVSTLPASAAKPHPGAAARCNILLILADDVGWGELGWQGGGKHRGTPTPALDKMAKQGIRFWHAYAEPSCTPSRIAINGNASADKSISVSSACIISRALGPHRVALAHCVVTVVILTCHSGRWLCRKNSMC